MTRWFPLLLLVSLFSLSTGCDRSSERPDDAPEGAATATPTTLTHQQTLDLLRRSMPEATLRVMRFDVDAPSEFWDLIIPFVDPPRYDPPEYQDILQFIEVSLLGTEDLLTFSTIDDSRPLLVVESARGNENYLRHIENAVIPRDPDEVFRGISVRLMLPAQSPSSLAESIESAAPDSHIQRVAVEGNYVFVDVHPDGLVLTTDPQSDDFIHLDYGQSQEDYWPHTPAAQQFWDSSTSFALYQKSADFLPDTILARTTRSFSNLRVNSDHPRFWQSNTRSLHLLARLDSPQRREFADFSVQAGLDSQGDLFGQAIRSLTEFGHQIRATRQHHPVELAGGDQGDLRFRWASPGFPPPADEASNLPWLSSRTPLIQLLNVHSAFPIRYVQFHHPMTFAQDAHTLDFPPFAPELLVPRIDGVSANLSWIEDPSARFGGYPQGEVRLRAENLEYDQAVRSVIDTWRGFGASIEREDIPDEDGARRTIVLRTEAGPSVDESSSAILQPGRLELSFDLSYSAPHIPLLFSALQRFALAIPNLQHLGRAHLVYDEFPHGSLALITTGKADFPGLPVPSGDFQYPTAQPLDDCLIEARNLVYEALFQRTVGQEPTDWQVLAADVERLRPTCSQPTASEHLDFILTRLQRH